MSDVDLNRVRDFLKIVELGNITRAAEALGERKAKLSRNLALLEQELGVQLVYRTTRQFKLTDSGAQFYQSMKTHLGAADQVISSIANLKDTVAGRLRLTAPEDLGHLVITPIVNEFSKLYPLVEFDLIYTNQVLDLVKLGIDVAFRIGPMRDSSLLHKKVGTIDFIIVAAPSYLEKSPSLQNPDDILKHETLDFAPQPQEKHQWRVVNKTSHRTLTLQPKMVANNYLILRDLTVLGHGLCLMPKFLAQPEVNSGRLIHVLKSWFQEGAPVQITMPAQKNVASKVRKFFDYSVQRL